MMNDELCFSYLPVVEWSLTCKIRVLKFLLRAKNNQCYVFDLLVWSVLLIYSSIFLIHNKSYNYPFQIVIYSHKRHDWYWKFSIIQTNSQQQFRNYLPRFFAVLSFYVFVWGCMLVFYRNPYYVIPDCWNLQASEPWWSIYVRPGLAMRLWIFPARYVCMCYI